MDSLNEDPIYINLYNKVQKAQSDIQSDILIARELEVHANQNQDELLIKCLHITIAQYKQYYMQILLIYILTNNAKNKVPFESFNSLLTKECKDSKEIIGKEFNYKNLPELLVFLNKKGDKDLIDIMTFSFIPSLFTVFIEEEKFKSFIEFINLLPPDLQPLYSRSLFLSPLLVKFFYITFYNNLKPFYEGSISTFANNLNSNQIHFLSNQILESIKSNIKLIPSYIEIFLKSFDDLETRKRILKEALFDPLIEHPEIFIVVDFYNAENPLTSSHINRILKQIISEDFITDFDKIIIENNSFYHLFLNKQYIDSYHKQLRDHIILSNIDQITMDFCLSYKKNKGKTNNKKIYKIIEGMKLKDYLLYNYGFEEKNNTGPKLYMTMIGRPREDDVEDEQKDDDHIEEEDTIEDADQWTIFRQFLKDCPPLLPIMETSTDNFDTIDDLKEPLLKLIDDNFIEKFDPMSSIRDQLNYQSISNKIQINKKNCDKRLKSIYIKHKKTQERLIANTVLQNELTHLNGIIINQSQFIKKVFISFMTRNIEPTLKPPMNIENIIKNPHKIVENMREYVKECHNLSLQFIRGVPTISKPIFVQRFYKNLTFNSYLSHRHDLLKYDQAIHHFLCENFYIVWKNLPKDGISKKLPIIIEHELSIFNAPSIMLKKAFECNCDPLSKIYYIFQILNYVTLDVCPSFGADETFTTSITFLAYSNPPHMISNLQFMLEYIQCEHDLDLLEASGCLTTLLSYSQFFMELDIGVKIKLDQFSDNFSSIEDIQEYPIQRKSFFDFLRKPKPKSQ